MLSLLKKHSERGFHSCMHQMGDCKDCPHDGHQRVCFSTKAKNNLLLGDNRGGVIMAGGQNLLEV